MTEKQFLNNLLNFTKEVNHSINEFNSFKKKVTIKVLTLTLIKQNLTYSEQLEFCEYIKEQTIKNKNIKIK